MALTFPKHGDGILLRYFRQEDAEPLTDIEYDADVKKYLAVPNKDRAEWLRSFFPEQIDGCAVESVPEQILAGHASITKTDTPGAGELRIVIAKRFWGRHLGRKVAALLIPAAFEEMHAESLRATVHPDNQASLALVESWGFAYRGKKDGETAHWQYGHLIYELTLTAYKLFTPRDTSASIAPVNFTDAP